MMKHQVTPYLTFDGKAKEALDYYKEVFAAEIVAVQTYGEADYPTPPEAENRIMYAQFKKNDFTIMVSDGFPDQPVTIGSNISLALELESDEEIDSLYGKLTQKGHALMELQDTFWGAKFAKVQDPYGVIWDLNFQKS